MPSIPIHSRAPSDQTTASAALPPLLQTPSGYAIVEMQGTINASASTSTATIASSLPGGRIVFPYYNASLPADDTSWHKRVYLYIGKHQRMTGEVKKLAKPLALIRRRGGGESEDLEIAEVVRWKLLFASRPEPVGGGGE